MVRREDRLNAHFKKLVAEFVNQHANAKISLVTITDFIIDGDFQTATAYISVFPDSETERVFELLKRRTRDLWQYLKNNSRMQTIPSVTFKIDRGEKNRQRIEHLIGR